ncbi:hypothetical protein SeMB42_g02317 [Synchytrium endobioticum]|uniref:Midasin n=1 Tax=Synchytrium endobioticum TaxID=286115 RepID=A0A507D740_9FUNG|nr:hypothetical protein SeLEV6574_g03110 [Synchytrium endobioticum]TPX50227.1 hypothetical protein SeMB42_g02317 [Synchytrium endobioticum]
MIPASINLSMLIRDQSLCIPSHVANELWSHDQRSFTQQKTQHPLDSLADLLLHPCLTLKIARAYRGILVDLVGRCRMRLTSAASPIHVCLTSEDAVNEHGAGRATSLTASAAGGTCPSIAPTNSASTRLRLALRNQRQIIATCACQTPSTEKGSDWSRSFLLLGALSNLLPVAPQLLGHTIAFLEAFELPFNLLKDNVNTPHQARFLARSIFRLIKSLQNEYSPQWSVSRLVDVMKTTDDKYTRAYLAHSLAILLKMVESEKLNFLRIHVLDSLIFLEDVEEHIDTLEKSYISIPDIVDTVVCKSRDSTVNSLNEDIKSVVQPTTTSTPIDLNIHESDLCPLTANLAGVLLNRVEQHQQHSESAAPLVHTTTLNQNLQQLALAISLRLPTLLCGSHGSGKSSLISEAARLVNQKAPFTIHLGDQTDSKLLIGTYISSKPGSFEWQPGVLTTAVKDGRWIVFEDVDLAPSEVISILIPLLESRQLFIPSRNELLKAHENFRIFATISSDSTGSAPSSSHIDHNWLAIIIKSNSISEIAHIIRSRYPTLSLMTDLLIAAYLAVSEYSSHTPIRGRNLTTLDLFKWCHRLAELPWISKAIHVSSIASTNNSTISMQQMEDVFYEGVVCFGELATGSSKNDIMNLLGHALQLPDHRVAFYRDSYAPESLVAENTTVRCGRYYIDKLPSAGSNPQTGDIFASATMHSRRLMQIIAGAISNDEPVLLVGETGTGKTTVIQYLAKVLNQKLVTLNLSNQSDSTDLLGGFKPVDSHQIIQPLYERFQELFSRTFPKKSNLAFLESVEGLRRKKKEKRLLAAMVSTIDKARSLHSSLTTSTEDRNAGTQPTKKRRTLDISLLQEWEDLNAEIARLEALDLKQPFFQFVDGPLTAAFRKGHFVLLDEVNLAPAETLEAISGLLNNGLIILEKDTTPIRKHPNFRLFANMNPSGDAGKRELPPGVRSRFTEIFVDSPDVNRRDLELITRQYLSNVSSMSKDVEQMIQDVLDFYYTVKTLSSYDGGGALLHVSVRTVSRALSFAREQAVSLSLHRALFEGLVMTFITQCSKESGETILQKLLSFSTFSRHGARSWIKHDSKSINSTSNPTIFHIPAGPHELHVDDQYVITDSVFKNLINLSRAVSAFKYPILIQGPTSSGKTSIIQYLAKRTGHQFVRVNNSENTDLQEYMGSYASDVTGNLVFQYGVLVNALRHGHWIVLDELNLAPTDVLEALNRLLDDNRELRIPETGEMIKPHPNFMLFATQNPPGLYGGRKPLSKAFRNRFLELHFEEVPANELSIILERRCRMAPSHAKAMVNVFNELHAKRGRGRVFDRDGFITLRDLFRWGDRSGNGYQELAEDGYMLLAERVRDAEDRLVVREVLERVMRAKINVDEMYNRLFDKYLECNILGSSHDASTGNITWTRQSKRLAVLLQQCLRHAEAVLLIGETGTGKTTICQYVASLFKKPLVIVNAHQSSEASDFLGSMRPVRVAEDTMDVDTNNNSSKAQSKRFEWVDGPLTTSIKNGSYFLLDELSLADDSVLERLNPLLETSRTITLTEKGGSHDIIHAHSDFRFMATMNPGGDYGKRELSPALRNRFTEIWVPVVDDLHDLSAIIETRLDVNGGNNALATEKCQIAQRMIEFILWFAGALEKLWNEIVSIRDIVAWCQFMVACIKKSISVDDAFVHGALMVFADGIGVNPLYGIIFKEDALRIRRQCMDKLLQLSPPQPLSLDFCTSSALTIHPFSIPRYTIPNDCTITTSDVPTTAFELNSQPSSYHLNAPSTLLNAMRVLRALQITKPILLEGPPGVGKTSLITAIGHLVRKPVVRINLSDQTDLMDLFGSDLPVEGGEPGEFAWRDGPFLMAMKRGDWVLLDELNLASQTVLEGLNACLDFRRTVYIPELDCEFPCHPEFRVFGAQNPYAEGGGRKGLPKSFTNRFTQVYVSELDIEDLRVLIQHMHPSLAIELVDKIIQFLNLFKGQFNLRDVLRWTQLIDKVPVEAAMDVSFGSRIRNDEDIARFHVAVDKVFGFRPATNIHWNITPNKFIIGKAVLDRVGLVHHPKTSLAILPSLLRPLAHMILGANLSWPILITGSAASGKTTLVRQIAALAQQPLAEFAMHPGVDAMELLGGFEQQSLDRLWSNVVDEAKVVCNMIRRKALLLDSSVACLDDIMASINPGNDRNNVDSSRVMDELQALAHELDVSYDFSQLHVAIARYASAVSNGTAGRFEWIDGALVQAVEHGYWLLIDNLNFCAASVLDRLNSLLEPNGVLLLNERGLVDGEVKIVKPHPCFRVFMTMDPLHGEISPAMRNRCLEIALPTPKWASNPDAMDTVRVMSSCGVLDRKLYASLYRNKDISPRSLISRGRILIEMLQRGTSRRDVLKSIYDDQAIHGDALQDFLYPTIWPASIGQNPVIWQSSAIYLSYVKELNSVSFSEYIGDVLATRLEAIHWLTNLPGADLAKAFLSRTPQAIRNTHYHGLRRAYYRLIFSSTSSDSSSGSENTLLARSAALASGLISSSLWSDEVLMWIGSALNSIPAFTSTVLPMIASESQGAMLNIVPAIHHIWDCRDDLMQVLKQTKLDMTVIFILFKKFNKSFNLLKTSIDTLVGSVDSRISTSLVAIITTLAELQQRGESVMSLFSSHNYTSVKAIQREWRGTVTRHLVVWQTQNLYRQLDQRFTLGSKPNEWLSNPWHENTAVKVEVMEALATLSMLDKDNVTESQRSSMIEVLDQVASGRLLAPLTESSPVLDLDHLKIIPLKAIHTVHARLRLLSQWSTNHNLLSRHEAVSMASIIKDRVVDDRVRMVLDWAVQKSSRSPSSLSHLQRLLWMKDHDASHPELKEASHAGLYYFFRSLWFAPQIEVNDLLFSSIQFLETDVRARMTGSEVLYQDILPFFVVNALTNTDKISITDIDLFRTHLEDLKEASIIAQEVPSSDEADRTMLAHFLALMRNAGIQAESVDSSSAGNSNERQIRGHLYLRNAISFLKAYIPRTPMDPALAPKIKRDTLMSRLLLLKEDITVRSEMEYMTTATRSNTSIEERMGILRCYEQQIANYESRMAIRPSESQLEDIFADLGILLDSIIPIVENLVDSLRSLSVSEQRTKESHLQDMLYAFVDKLENSYTMYKDLLQPICQAILYMKHGLRLITMNFATLSMLHTFTIGLPDNSGALSPTINMQRLNFSAAVSKRVEIDEFSKVVESVAGKWRADVEQAYNEKVTSSSIFRYKELVEDVVFEEYTDFDATVASRGDAEPTPPPSHHLRAAVSDVEELRRHFVKLFTAIIVNVSEPPDHGHRNTSRKSDSLAFLEYFTSLYIRALGSVTCNQLALEDQHRLSKGQLVLIDSMLQTKLQQTGVDFYRDSNPVELAGALMPVLTHFQTRVLELLSKYPEHSVLQNLADICSRLANLPMSTPIPRILNGLQIMLMKANDWESYSSRELSLKSVMGELTQLIIQWRKLELSSWMQLLTIEESRTAEASEMFWIHLYTLIEEDDETRLLEGLDEYCLSCPCGEFQSRLQMIDAMCTYLHLSRDRSADGGSSINPKVNLLKNLHRYYQLLSTLVNDNISSKRKPIQTQLIDFVKIATWKDVNVYALEATTKKSHHQLMKMIKKYKQVLREPIINIMKVGSQSLLEERAAKCVADTEKDRQYLVKQGCSTFSVELNDISRDAFENIRRIQIANEQASSAEGSEGSERKLIPRNIATKALVDIFRELKELGLSNAHRTTDRKTWLNTGVDRVSAILDTPLNLSDKFYDMMHQISKLNEVALNPTPTLPAADSHRCVALCNHIFKIVADMSAVNDVVARHAQSLLSIVEPLESSCSLSHSATALKELGFYYDRICNIYAVLVQSDMIHRSSGGVQLGDTSRDVNEDNIKRAHDIISPIKLQLLSTIKVLEYQPVIAVKDKNDLLRNAIQALRSVKELNIVEVDLSGCIWPLDEVEQDSTPNNSNIVIHVFSHQLLSQPCLEECPLIALCRHYENWSVSLSAFHHCLSSYIDSCHANGESYFSINSSLSQQLLSLLQDIRTKVIEFGIYYKHLTQFGFTIVNLLVSVLTKGLGYTEGRDDENEPSASQIADGTGVGEGEGARDVTDELDNQEQAMDTHDQTRTEQTSSKEDQPNGMEMDEDFDGQMEDVPEDGDGNDEDQDDDEHDEEFGDLGDSDNQRDQKVKSGGDDGDGEMEGPQMNDESASSETVAKTNEQSNPDKPSEEDLKSPEQEAESDEKEDQGTSQNAPKPMDDSHPNVLENDPDLQFEGKCEDASDKDVTDDADGNADLQNGDEVDPQDDSGEKDGEKEEDEINLEDMNLEEDGGDMDADYGDESMEAQVGDEHPLENEDGQVGDQELRDEDTSNVKPSNAKGVQGEYGVESNQDNMDLSNDNPSSSNDNSGSSSNQKAGVGADLTGPEPNTENTSNSKRDSSKQQRRRPDVNPNRSLGDVLKSWLDRLNEIRGGQQAPDSNEFEYVENDEDAADAQAISNATAEQASSNILMDRATDQEDVDMTEALQKDHDVSLEKEDSVLFTSKAMAKSADADDKAAEGRDGNEQAGSMSDVVGDDVDIDASNEHHVIEPLYESLDQLRQELEQSISLWISSTDKSKPSTITTDACIDWHKYTTLTRHLSIQLYNQLQLILQPTLQSHLKGDYKTGKRLNMRKIIPYIASNFKKDRIWLRRTKPNKREYRVLLAIDDSKSMAESHCVQLAFESLALIAKALSQLEVGQVAVASFGERMQVLHPFDRVFDDASGASVIDRFTFSQTKTNVQDLLTQSIAMFSHGGSSGRSGADLWGLQIVISDGIMSDHDVVRSMVKVAAERRVITVFVIIDNLHGGESITKMTNVKYVERGGSMDLQLSRYMDTFPFDYYVHVKSIDELPVILSDTLRQFFLTVSNM